MARYEDSDAHRAGRCPPQPMITKRHIPTVSLCALAMLFPIASAQAQEAAAPESAAPVATVPAEAPTPETEPSAAPAPASEPQPAAKPAQSSAPNEYFESGVPTGTGDDEPADTVDSAEPQDDAPQSNA